MGALSLNDIGLKYGTDKSSATHDYLSFYEFFLEKKRNSQVSILEVGVLDGQSLKTWEEYFPKAKLVGVDIAQGAKRFEGGRIAIEIADQSNIEQMCAVALKHGPFDVVIEDGSHVCEHQITTLKTLFPFVREDGIYIVEDLQTNYGDMLVDYRGVSSITCVDYLKMWLDLRVADDQIDIGKVEDAFLRTYGRAIQSITFYRRACLIKKDYRNVAFSYDSVLVDDKVHAKSKGVTVLAHLSFVGDVYNANGCPNGSAAGSMREVQGLSISSSLGVLQYKAMGLDGAWTDWVDEGAFVGTRGKSQFLAGLAVRVKGNREKTLTVRTTCRFGDGGAPATAVDGEECRSGDGRPLCAVQVDLAPRA